LLVILVLSISVLLQFAAAFYALLLIKVSGKTYSWVLISAALFLMGFRRLIPLCYSLLTAGGYAADLVNESIGLVLSLLMLLGVMMMIKQIFIERNRLQEQESAFGEISYHLVSPASIDEIAYQVLDYAEWFTQSPLGYVGYINQKTGKLIVPAHTIDALAKCRVENKSSDLKNDSCLWGWSLNDQSFFTNTPSAGSESVETPTGQQPFNRFLSAPALFEGKLVWQIAVANSSKEYTKEDVRVVECLATLYAIAIQRRHIEDQLQEYANSLEAKVAERTKQLEEANQRLVRAERLAAIGELAGIVGHDLRNPLTGIKTAAYYLRLKKSKDLDDTCKELLEVIDHAITHADKIISDLQDYAREMQLELVDCSPRAIMQEALTVVRIPDRVKLIDSTLDAPLIRADKTKMARVFINIIRNAVDAMPEGGTLQIKSIQKNGNVEISFADTGIGIPEETLSKLFSPLVTTKAQGMGFGLAICKRMVDAHQGSITVQSFKGQGSTFTVTIPIKPKGKNEAKWISPLKS